MRKKFLSALFILIAINQIYYQEESIYHIIAPIEAVFRNLYGVLLDP
jgi:hypothetical protein